MKLIRVMLIACAVMFAVGSPFVVRRVAIRNLQSTEQTVRQQALQLTNLTKESTYLSNIVQSIESSNALSQTETMKLAHLRLEAAKLQTSVGQMEELQRRIDRLRDRLTDAAAERQNGVETDTALLKDVMEHREERLLRMKRWLENTPEQSYPELQFLKTEEWLNAMVRPLIAEDDFQAAASLLRFTAADTFGTKMFTAVRNYAKANNGQFPRDAFDLKPYLPSDIPNLDRMLERYAVIPTATLPQMFVSMFGSDSVIAPRERLSRYDNRVIVGLTNISRGVPWDMK
ncbi:MAG: polymerase, sigma-24 subunit, subfamily [Verrucomicrobiales bacterium]|nr:polymerase, sigma-24 subunit, subfamily [Verrucomicrobiales bacterium]